MGPINRGRVGDLTRGRADQSTEGKSVNQRRTRARGRANQQRARELGAREMGPREMRPREREGQLAGRVGESTEGHIGREGEGYSTEGKAYKKRGQRGSGGKEGGRQRCEGRDVLGKTCSRKDVLERKDVLAEREGKDLLAEVPVAKGEFGTYQLGLLHRAPRLLHHRHGVLRLSSYTHRQRTDTVDRLYNHNGGVPIKMITHKDDLGSSHDGVPFLLHPQWERIRSKRLDVNTHGVPTRSTIRVICNENRTSRVSVRQREQNKQRECALPTSHADWLEVQPCGKAHMTSFASSS